VIQLDAGNIVGASWLVFGAYWIISALRVKQKRMIEPGPQRLIRFVILCTAFILLYKDNPRFGLLNERFVPPQDQIRTLAAALTLIGVAFAIWARYHIGQYWSSSVSLKVDHKLIRTGPYAHIRHPIYTGILLALTGTTLLVGEYRALLGLVLWFVGLTWKALNEEALLAGEFGPAFEEHKRLTGFFLPR
jgi:protein-S-isoprenylcysteine O-methyltransferase Ste14